MKILVTGGAGFVGKNLVRLLVNHNHDITVLEHPSASVHGLPENVTVVQPDLSTDWKPVLEILAAAQPEFIVHLAAIVRAKPEREWLEPLVRTNISFGAHLLQAAVDIGATRFISAGSYWQSQTKAGEYDPVNLYAATKQSFADLLEYYGRKGMVHTVLLKLFGNYGPDDDRNNLFAALKESVHSECPVPMTDGHQSIDVIHIDDVCSAFLAAIQSSNLQHHSEFEVGTGETASIRQIAKWFSNGVGSDLNLGWGQLPSPSHHERAADTEMIRARLDWHPIWPIETGIRSLGESYAK